MALKPKTRIAHLAGPTATIQNTPPLVTSNKARLKYGLPPRRIPTARSRRSIALRAQRLAAPAKVYVEQFSAHPLEADAGRALRSAGSATSAPTETSRKTRASRQRQAGLRDRAAAGRRPLSAALHGGAGRRQSVGRGMREPGRARQPRRGRASSPTGRAASRRSTASRSASTAWRA